MKNNIFYYRREVYFVIDSQIHTTYQETVTDPEQRLKPRRPSTKRLPKTQRRCGQPHLPPTESYLCRQKRPPDETARRHGTRPCSRNSKTTTFARRCSVSAASTEATCAIKRRLGETARPVAGSYATTNLKVFAY